MLQKETVLVVKDLYASIGDTPVLQQISFTISMGQKLAIIGENGAGKSTLLKAIGGLIQIDAGTILFKGKAIKGPLEQLIPGNAGIAYLSQYFELRNNYTVQDLLQVFSKADTATAAAIYKVCEIYPLMQRRTNELSGGEKQRICLAIALSEKPAVLLLDEPFSNADILHKQKLKSVIDNIIALFNVAVLFVSHEAADALSWAGELLILDKGSILQQGSPQEVYYKPRNEWAAGLLGAYNIIRKDSPFWEKYFATRTNASKVLVRPDQIQIDVSTQEGMGMEGEVIGYSFNGLYGCYTIQAGDEVFIIATIAEQYKKGQTIQLCPLQNLQYSIIE